MAFSGIGDVAAIISLGEKLIKLYQVCFSQIQEPGEQVRKLGTLLNVFIENLKAADGLYTLVKSSELCFNLSYLPGLRLLKSIINASSPILRHGYKFLEKYEKFILKRGPKAKLEYHLAGAEEEFDELRKQIGSMSGQLDTALLTINIHLLTLKIIPVDRLSGVWPRRDPQLQECDPEAFPLQIPPDLAIRFWNAVIQIYHNPNDAPVMLCVDTSSKHLSRAQRRLEIDCKPRLHQDQVIDIYLDLMLSGWILETLVKPRSSHPGALSEIQETEPSAPLDVESLVLRLSEAHIVSDDRESRRHNTCWTPANKVKKLHNLLKSPVLRNLSLDEDIDRALTRWNKHFYILWTLPPGTPEDAIVNSSETDGEEDTDFLLSGYMVSGRSKQEIKVYQSDDKTLLMVRERTGRSNSTDEQPITIPLYGTHFSPYCATSGLERDTLDAFLEIAENNTSETLHFWNLKTLLQFQHSLTGYEVKHRSWKISVNFQNGRFRRKTEPEYGMLQIWQHNPLKLKSENEKVSQLMKPPHTPPFRSSSVSSNENQFSGTCSITSLPQSPQNSSHKIQTSFQSTVADNSTKGIILPNPDPPRLILLIKEDSDTIPLSLVCIEVDHRMKVTKNKDGGSLCKSVDLKVPSGIKTRRRDTENVTAAGIYQCHKGPWLNQELYRVTITFSDENSRENFISNFETVQGLYRKKFVQDAQKAIEQ